MLKDVKHSLFAKQSFQHWNLSRVRCNLFTVLFYILQLLVGKNVICILRVKYIVCLGVAVGRDIVTLYCLRQKYRLIFIGFKPPFCRSKCLQIHPKSYRKTVPVTPYKVDINVVPDNGPCKSPGTTALKCIAPRYNKVGSRIRSTEYRLQQRKILFI